MHKYQFFAILAFLAVIDSHVANNSVSQWSSWFAAIVFTGLTVLNWGKKD